MKKRTWLKLLCLLLILTFSLGLAACTEGQPQNPDSSGEVPGSSDGSDFSVSAQPSDVDLSQYAPAELIEVDGVNWDEVCRVSAQIDYVGEKQVWSNPDLSCFRGTVQSFKTLRVDAGLKQIGDVISSDIRYYAVLTVRVDDLFRGTMDPGGTVTVYLSVVDDLGYFDYVKDAYESLAPGREGIFGVVAAKGYSLTNDGKILTFPSLAEYGVSFYMLDENPVSFQFLGRTLSFPSLDGGEEYLRGKLEEYPCQ